MFLLKFFKKKNAENRWIVKPLEGLSNVSFGMTIGEVKEILGEPDEIEDDATFESEKRINFRYKKLNYTSFYFHGGEIYGNKSNPVLCMIYSRFASICLKDKPLIHLPFDEAIRLFLGDDEEAKLTARISYFGPKNGKLILHYDILELQFSLSVFNGLVESVQWCIKDWGNGK